MSTYKELRGLRVKYVPTDTTSPSTAAAGDVWYNTASGQLKGYVGIAAWSAGGNLITARQVLAGAGTQTAGLGFGGITTANTTATEEYNGSGWAAGGALNTARRSLSGTGTQTAGLAAGGYTTTVVNTTEEYNGSAWTASNNLNTARSGGAAAGTQTAGLLAGGYNGTASVAIAETYDGSSWTEVGDLNTARQNHAAAGTQTAGLAFGGGFPDPGQSDASEEYDGSSWAEGNNLNTARQALGGTGTQTAGLAFGGDVHPDNHKALSESYDGTSWTEGPDLSTAREVHGGAGTQPAALAFGGFSTAITGSTEEYNNSFQVVTAGAWSSGGNMPVAVYGGASFGIQTSAVHSAGVPPANAADNDTYEYNGSTWSSGGALPANRQSIAAAGASETSGLAFCGAIPSNSQPSHTFHNNTYEYDGSSWTNGGNYPTGLSATGGSGTQTAAIGAGGTSTAPGAPGITNASATYDGSSWTAAPNTGSSATRHNMITGTTTSAVSIANYPPFGCEEFDGSSWTAGGTPNVADYSKAHTGTSSSAALVAGRDSAPREQCESYNGTTWATSPNVTTGRASMGTGRGVNPTATALAFGGYSPPGNSNSTEEFTAETSAATASTIDFD